MWKCNGSAWSLEGNLKGQKGDKGYSPSAYVTKDGDTATITIIDETGATTESISDGTNGNRWFRGTVVSGKATAPTQFTLDFAVNTDDNYINTSERAVYHCTQGAAENEPTLWSYDFTLTGGGGGGVTDYADLDGKPQIENHTLNSGNNTAASLGLATSEEVKKKYTKPSTGIPKSDLALDVYQKLANLDADGEIDYSHVKNTPTIPTADGWITTTDQATATGEANIRFNVSDTSKAYKLFYESSNNGVVNQKAVSVSGNTITYTVDVPSTTNVPVSFKLRVFN